MAVLTHSLLREESLTRPHFSQVLKEVNECVRWFSREKTFHTEGTVSAKALRRDSNWRAQRTARRPKQLEQRGQESQ